MKAVPSSLGSALKLRRRRLGLSQAEVAESIGKKQSQIARIEGGSADSRLSSLVQLSRSLGAELVAVPIQLLPAVRHLIAEFEGSAARPGRFVGNDPEDADDAEADDES
jgi:transcriptional regulator with XRE-family HTH domain